MEFLMCKACGSVGMVPMDVRLLDEVEDEESGDETAELLDYLAGPIGEEDSRDPGQGEHEADEVDDGDEDEESRFYSCHVCGDNWLSIRRHDDDGQSKVTFIHQMGVEPVLRRIAHLQAELLNDNRAVDHWEYYLDDDEVAEGEWMDKLEDRRKVLRAICSN